MHRLLVAVLASLLPACTLPQRFEGHWTRLDADRGVFQDVRGQRYFLNDFGLPRSVTRFVEARPEQAGRRASQTPGSAYLELSAYVDDRSPDCLYADSPDRLPRLEVFWVRKIAPAHPDFLAAPPSTRRPAPGIRE